MIVDRDQIDALRAMAAEIQLALDRADRDHASLAARMREFGLE